MDAYQRLEWMLDLAEQIGLTVRRMPAASDGAGYIGGTLIRLKGVEVLFLDTSASLADQTAAVAAALVGRDELEDRFIPPEVRDILQPE